MKIFVIADAETFPVYALAGLKGVAVNSETEVPVILDGLSRESTGLIFITEDLAQNNREAIERMMLDSDKPLIVEIPGIKGPVTSKVRSSEHLISLMKR